MNSAVRCIPKGCTCPVDGCWLRADKKLPSLHWVACQPTSRFMLHGFRRSLSPASQWVLPLGLSCPASRCGCYAHLSYFTRTDAFCRSLRRSLLLYLSLCVLYTALILGEGCLTGMTDRTNCLGYLPSHTDIAHFEFKPSEFRTTFR